MKKLLLLMCSVIFVLSSCNEVSNRPVAEGTLTEIGTTSATIDGKVYHIDSNVDFILNTPLSCNGEKVFVYASGDKLFVSKINKQNIGTIKSDSLILGLTETYSLFLAGILTICYLVICRHGAREIRGKRWLIYGILSILPTITLLLGKSFPKLQALNFTSCNVEFLDFGKLISQDSSFITLNGKQWRILETTSLDEKKLKISESYAIISINGEKKLAQASSSKQIKTEIEYINKTQKNYGWLDFTIIVLNLLGLYFSISIYFFRPKVKMESEITTDEKNGHSYQQEKA